MRLIEKLLRRRETWGGTRRPIDNPLVWAAGFQ